MIIIIIMPKCVTVTKNVSNGHQSTTHRNTSAELKPTSELQI